MFQPFYFRATFFRVLFWVLVGLSFTAYFYLLWFLFVAPPDPMHGVPAAPILTTAAVMAFFVWVDIRFARDKNKPQEKREFPPQ